MRERCPSIEIISETVETNRPIGVNSSISILGPDNVPITGARVHAFFSFPARSRNSGKPRFPNSCRTIIATNCRARELSSSSSPRRSQYPREYYTSIPRALRYPGTRNCTDRRRKSFLAIERSLEKPSRNDRAILRRISVPRRIISIDDPASRSRSWIFTFHRVCR